jgi:hypothetical protein
MLKECSTCQAYIFPPEDSKGAANIGTCPEFGLVNEKDYCEDWIQREEE